MNAPDEISDTAAELREAFDSGFGSEPAGLAEPPLDFLHIRVAGRSFLIDLVEVAGVRAGAVISPFPSSMRELLGMIGMQGELVPVFGLAGMLGLDTEKPQPRWIILSRSHDVVGFAFDLLEGHLGLSRNDVAPVEAGQGPRHVRATGLVAGVRYPILHMGMLLEQLRSGAAVLADTVRGGHD